MKVFTIVLAIFDVIFCLSLVGLVLFQQGQSRGLGAIAGGAQTFFGKSKGRSIDGMLKKITTAVAIIFMITTVTLYLLTGRGA